MSRKKNKKAKAQDKFLNKQEPAQDAPQKNQYSNPIIGLARLFEFLGSCQSFPVNVRTAACVSGIAEDEVRRILQGSLYYFVWKDDISNCRTA
ncbi:hypothetical protein [Dehalobacter sp. TeCB1]|uniref:hypothetical protein n=1 Tax=Dehalobacter sp. TeCB1 TaxID=1843715 RepID=UPI00083AEEB4|nr:hypothetical protein [Dehalobacter sp. TeCB1]OCZ53815.1 hypothetical protein A7D23_07590 [Dehalobacter sp. TeCB1]